jgi:site-specific DNA recombinase
MENKRAVIYCRVSTKEQVEEGNSLITQEKNCREYALKNSYEIVQVFIEQGESAKTIHRTELKKLMSFCTDRKNNINAVIAYKIDRISRNIADYTQIRLLLKQKGVDIKSTSEHFEDTPAGKFMENIIANVAQFDNDVRTERTVGGLKEAVREGRYVGCAPLGYDNIRIAGKANIVFNSQAPLVKKTFELIAKNVLTVEDVRKQMIKEGLSTKGGKLVSRSQFYRLLKNSAYAGLIFRFGEINKGVYQPLISEELFNHVQQVLNKRKKNSVRTYTINNPDFPLRRFVVHSSGLKLTGSWSQGKTKKYAYYRFLRKGLEFSKSQIEDAFKNFLGQYEYDENKFEMLKQKLKENVIQKQADKIKKAKLLEQKIADLNSKQTVLIEKNIQGVISNHILQQQLSFVESEILKTHKLLLTLPNANRKIESLLEFAKEFLKNPDKIWEIAPVHLKLRLQWFEFPQGITFDGKVFRTQEIRNLFKAKSFFLTKQSHLADSKLISTNNLELPTSLINKDDTELLYWESIADDIEELAGIMTAMKEDRKELVIDT